MGGPVPDLSLSSSAFGPGVASPVFSCQGEFARDERGVPENKRLGPMWRCVLIHHHNLVYAWKSNEAIAQTSLKEGKCTILEGGQVYNLVVRQNFTLFVERNHLHWCILSVYCSPLK